MKASDFAGNRLAVLKEIRTGEPVSRADLPARTGLSAGTITQVTGELLSRGLVVERKAAAKGRGRPRAYLEIADGDEVVLGVNLTDLGSLSVTFVDLHGRERYGARIPCQRTYAMADLADLIVATLRQAIAQSGIAPAAILHAGIGLPAVVDSVRGTVHFLMFHEGTPYDLAGHVARALGLPVTIENDTACLARAEHWFGCARDVDTFTLVHVSYAIASAQYEGGIPHAGPLGMNCELGHTKTAYGAEARPCYCGTDAFGCASAHASLHALGTGIRPQGELRIPPLAELDRRVDEVLARAVAGDVGALAEMAEAGEHLGRMLVNHINGSVPGTVILLMPDPRYEALVKPVVNDIVERRVLTGYRGVTQIRFETALPDWRIKGTAALALEQAFLRPEGAIPAVRPFR